MNSREVIAAGSAAAVALQTHSVASLERSLRLQFARSPRDKTALAQLAGFLADHGRTEETAAVLLRAPKDDPALDGVRTHVARIMLDRGQPFDALEQIEALSPAARASLDVRTLEAALLGILGRHEPEIAIYEQLLASLPSHEGLWKSLGDALNYAGRGEAAARAFRKAVSLNSQYGEGWWGLANLKSAQFDGRDISAMRRAVRRSNSATDTMHLLFALGKALEDRGDYADSFRHYAAGNHLRASALSPAAMSVSEIVGELVCAFDSEVMARVGTVGHPSEGPIFVVGLQRSGSTLIEQILATHPDIEGTTELLAMQQIWSEFGMDARMHGRSLKQHLMAVPDERFNEMGRAYLEKTRPFRQRGASRFVDKQPANWMQASFVRLILPNAKIIDTRRHPMACGFSNFKQHYATGVNFAYSQTSIAEFYRDYLQFMRHVRRQDPDAVHLAINERLIENTEHEVRALLDFVGVPFDAACLTSHRTARAVNTPSSEQVRRPINRDGMNYWRHYEPWLGPLAKSLGPAIADWQD